MTPKERLIDGLRRLCDAHGVEGVADTIQASAEGLRQILRGTLLPSGEPRGVGPTVAKKLSAAFPGWDAQAPQTAPNPKPSQEQVAIDQVVAELAKRLDELDEVEREYAAVRLQTLAQAPDSQRARDALTSALRAVPRTTATFATTPSRKRRRA